ncbi:hypothetical protein [Lysinibacillus xylanilyticus]|uniref:hypothetical protein n=1 Tax=Lysinibacillus xylanilyticus TaxID=582475 RepID=UPI00381549DF
MIDKKKISAYLKIIESMTQNGASPNLDKYWNEIVSMLSEDLNQTIEYLSNCEEHDLWIMGGYFEDISYNLQSKAFIDFLKLLQEKYTNIDMSQDIEWAAEAIE